MQHTPSAQNPLAHWLLTEHAAPFGVAIVQTPATQIDGAVHCAFDVQSVPVSGVPASSSS